MRPSVLRRPLQIATFLRKEAVEVLRQPRLLLTMVIGPFLIMAAFGLGYRDTPERMRTLFVAPEGSPLLDQVESYADEIKSYVEFAGATTDPAFARRQLLDGEVDLLVSFPDDPLETVLQGDRATVTVVHTRLDPIEQTAINFASQLGIAQINGQILAAVVAGGQELATPAEGVFAAADVAVDALDDAMVSQDEEATAAALDDLEQATGQVSLAVRASTALLAELGPSDGTTDDASDTVTQAVDELRTSIDEIRTAQSSGEASEQVTRIRELLGTISTNYDELTAVDSAVLVQPFASDVELAVDSVEGVTDWYAPAAVILMLQQFGVAFGALSFVRERQLGIVDVYRVAPVHATETLLGKYLAYLVIGGAIGAALMALVVNLLGVPIASGITDIGVVIALTLFASIGLGFVISLASASDAQAVQYTMIVLLASLFFSGFFLALDQLEGPSRYIRYLLPVSYAMQMLRDVMLRGAEIDRQLWMGLAAFGVGAFGLALIGARRRMSLARE
ncbi:MAG: ABC transporter permease [Actinomycetota bacterium]|nr:ABC transporter permease [Actinomycetota bacterium]